MATVGVKGLSVLERTLSLAALIQKSQIFRQSTRVFANLPVLRPDMPRKYNHASRDGHYLNQQTSFSEERCMLFRVIVVLW